MFRLVKEFNTKKIYHFMKEISHKESNALIVFENYNEFCINFIEFMRNKYPKIKITEAFTNSGSKKLVNIIDPSKLIKSYLAPKYDLVCIVPYVTDEYNTNKEYFGLPISIDQSVNFQNDLIDYYGLKKFVVFVLNNNISYKLVSKIIDSLLPEFEIQSVLLGHSYICAEVHNLCLTNPVVIYNNTFLSEQFLGKSFIVFSDTQVDNEEFVYNSIVEKNEK